MSLEDIRYHLTPEREDKEGFALPTRASDWAALTNDEIFRLRRKIERDNRWPYSAQLENEMTTRLIQAMGRLQRSSDVAASRLYLLTWALVVLTVVIAAFTVALFFRG